MTIKTYADFLAGFPNLRHYFPIHEVDTNAGDSLTIYDMVTGNLFETGANGSADGVTADVNSDFGAGNVTTWSPYNIADKDFILSFLWNPDSASLSRVGFGQVVAVGVEVDPTEATIHGADATLIVAGSGGTGSDILITLAGDRDGNATLYEDSAAVATTAMGTEGLIAPGDHMHMGAVTSGCHFIALFAYTAGSLPTITAADLTALKTNATNKKIWFPKTWA